MEEGGSKPAALRATILAMTGTRMLALALFATSCLPLAAQTKDDAVLAPINAMFDGMAKRDAAAIKASAIPGATMVLMRDGVPSQMTLDAFADRIGHPSAAAAKIPIAETIHDPVIRVDNDLAVVWAPFDFLLDGKVDHCGTDLFNLVRAKGTWLIASVADTGRKDCPAH
jgi:hypothetical protein